MGSVREGIPRRHIALALIAVLFVLSLPFPAVFGRPRPTPPSLSGVGQRGIEAQDWQPGVPGLLCLLGVPWVCFFPAWWANPALVVGYVGLELGAEKLPRRAAWVALVLAASCPLLYGRMEIGYWLWLASIACLVICTYLPGPRPFRPGKVSETTSCER